MSERTHWTRLDGKRRRANSWLRDNYGYIRTGWELSAVLAGILLALALVITCINAGARHYEAKACRGYGAATERPTKFASYSWWNYECLVQTSDGRWVNKDGGSRIEVNDR